MKKCLTLIFFLYSIYLPQAIGQSPSNDNCINAVQLCAPFTAAGTTTGAGVDCSGAGSEDSDCLLLGLWGSSGACFDLNNSVWYNFSTNATGGNVNINISNIACLPGGGTELQAAVFSYVDLCDASTFTLVSTCENGSAGDFLIFAPALPPNTSYLVVVDGNPLGGLNAECDFEISASGAVGPAMASPSVSHVSCFGLNDGAALINFTASSGSETYTWTPDVSVTNAATDLSPGPYSVLVSDPVGGCSATVNLNINEPPLLSPVIVEVADENCGMLDGYIDMAISGGTSPFEYLWTPTGFTTQDLAIAAAGIYTFTVTDASGCTATMNNILLDGIGVGSADALVSDVSCVGLNDGQVFIDYIGSTTIATYNWSPPVSNNNTASGLPPGDYSVDINTGTGTVDVNLFQENFELGTFFWNLNVGTGTNQWVANNVYAGEECTSAGTPLFSIPDVPDQPFGITAFPQSNYLHISGSTAGVCDAPWPPENGNYDPNEPSNQIAEMANGISTEGYSNVDISFYWLCLGEASDFGNVEYSIDGAASWVPLGGPYNLSADEWQQETLSNPAFDNQPDLRFRFRWRNNGTGGANPGFCIDQILVRGEISSPGVFCPATVSFTIEEPEELTAAVIGVTDEDCGANNGSIDIDVMGGTLPYSFIWSPIALGTEDLTDIEAGLYSVSITDGGDCSLSLDDILVNTTGSASATVTSSDISCFGADDGSASIDFPLGSGFETYSWTPDVSSTNSATGLSPGDYSVFIDDPGNSVSTVTLFLESFEGGLTDWTLNSGFGGNQWFVDDFYAGGTCTFYSAALFDVPDVPNQPTPVAGSPQSNYLHIRATTSLTASCDLPWPPGNANYDSFEGSEQYATMNTGISTIGYSNVNLTFYWLAMGDDADFGEVEYSVDGGTIWNTAAPMLNMNPAWILENISNPVFDGQADLRFRFKWTNDAFTGANPAFAVDQIRVLADTTGFVESCTTTLDFTITEPAILTGTVDNVLGENCNLSDGAIDISVSGGTAPYSFSWLPDVGNTEDISGIPAGIYSVTITDSNDCVTTISDIAVNSIGGPVISLESVTDAHCDMPDGSVDVTVTDGNPPYTFNWSAPGSISEDLSAAFPGSYDLTVTDNIGCISVLPAVVVGNIPGPAISVDNVSDEICGSADGAIDISVVGGSGPINYLWSPGSLTSEDISTLNAGLYSILVTDSVGCTDEITDIVVNSIGGPSMDVASIINANCGLEDGSIDMNTIDGTGPYMYVWLPGMESTEDIAGIPAGTYTITVTDALGCSFSVSDIVVDDEDAPSLSIVGTTDETCSLSNGAIDISVDGGTLPYSFNWDPGMLMSEDLSGIGAGTYSITVTDANGCGDSLTDIEIINTDGPLIDLVELINVTCFESNDGSIDVDILGGTLPYNIIWSNDNTGEENTGLSAGTYTITVSDFNDCTSTMDYTITQPDELIVDAGDDIFILPESSGSLNASLSAAASVTWIPPIGLSCTDCLDPIASPQETTEYFITAIDNSGCIDMDSVTVDVSLPEFIIPNVFTPNNDGSNDVFRIPYSAAITSLEFRVYNRWGELVFFTSDPSSGWDGTYEGIPQEIGTYIYMIEGERRGKEIKAHGNVTLMR